MDTVVNPLILGQSGEAYGRVVLKEEITCEPTAE